MKKHILVVDDEPDIRSTVKEILEDEEFVVSTAENAIEARQLRSVHTPDLVLLDIWMPGEDGISLLKEWQANGGLNCPVVMMSGHGNVETAVEATRLGAYDFIEKPISMAKLLLTVTEAIAVNDKIIPTEVKDAPEKPKIMLEPIGSSVLMKEARQSAKMLAETERWAVLCGFPGVGKRSFAQYIHQLGPRAEQPLVEVDAEVLCQQDVAAELFGYEENGQSYPGILERANGGVLYIHEVAELDWSTQGLLLGVLQNRLINPIGKIQGTTLDVQILVSSSRSLKIEVEHKRFRDTLFHLLNVAVLNLPPLKTHTEDVPELLNHFVDHFNIHEGLPYRHFSVASQNYLRHYDWPGNVLELRNLVQRLLIQDSQVDIEPSEIEACINDSQMSGTPVMDSAILDLPLREARERFEREYLIYQLRAVQGNVTRLAEKVGMERTNLYRKLRALSIDPKQVGV